MALKGIKIKQTENIFIDGETGQQLTPQQFAQRYKKTGMGGFRSVLAETEGEGEETEEEGQEDLPII